LKVVSARIARKWRKPANGERQSKLTSVAPLQVRPACISEALGSKLALAKKLKKLKNGQN